MNWGFQKLGVSELTPDRPALNFEFVRCEKSWFCVGKPPNPRSHANFHVFCSKSCFCKMNWGFQELGVAERTPDRLALNFEFVRCEKSWFCVGVGSDPGRKPIWADPGLDKFLSFFNDRSKWRFDTGILIYRSMRGELAKNQLFTKQKHIRRGKTM